MKQIYNLSHTKQLKLIPLASTLTFFNIQFIGALNDRIAPYFESLWMNISVRTPPTPPTPMDSNGKEGMNSTLFLL